MADESGKDLNVVITGDSGASSENNLGDTAIPDTEGDDLKLGLGSADDGQMSSAMDNAGASEHGANDDITDIGDFQAQTTSLSEMDTSDFVTELSTPLSQVKQVTELNKGQQRSPVAIQPKPGSKPALQVCIVCKKVCKCKYNIVRNGDIKHLCGEECFSAFRNEPGQYLRGTLQQNCGFCLRTISLTQPMSLSVEEQLVYFCGKSCNDGYRKTHTCAHCKKLYKVSKKANYCSLSCADQAGQSASVKLPTGRCSVCQKTCQLKHQAALNRSTFCYCSEICLSAFIKANKSATITLLGCEQCGKACPKSPSGTELFTLQFEGRKKTFCSGACRTQFKASNSHLVACSWCHNKKQSADMLAQEEDGMVLLFCALSCLSLYRVNKQATSTSSVKCDQCDMIAPAQYHLTMSDASVRNFCSYNCVIAFQSQFTAPKTPQKTASTPKQATQRTQTPQTKGKAKGKRGAGDGDSDDAMQISNVVSLAPNEVHRNANYIPRGNEAGTQITSPPAQPPIGNSSGSISNSTGGGSAVVIMKPQEPIVVRNKSTMCKPVTMTKATSCRPHTQSKETQTDESMEKQKPVLIPVPIPIYIPVPMPMYSVPVPHPLPMGIPVPVPVFIPTTRNSASGILKQIEKMRDTLPADPYEAEMLMMAEAVAGGVESDDSASEAAADDDGVDGQEDVLSMALRMATEMPTGSGEDFESSVNATAINPSELSQSELSAYDTSQDDSTIGAIEDSALVRNAKRKADSIGRSRPKKMKVDEEPIEEKYQAEVQPVVAVPHPEVPMDQNTVLKFSYGVNAWKHWVAMKNMELEKTATVPLNRLKLFKLDLLACSPDELNYALSLFVKEVRKPNGDEYAPDSIYYLCLGVQEYLLENGRVDNIFTDFFYESYNRALNEVLQNYEVRLNAQGLIVCRIEEEHLWEAKQLGAHSPHVLLNTLVYFNTKYFLLRTPDDHLRLSFSHIMKHWKKTGKAGGRSVYLRFYAPATDPIQRGRRKEEIPVLEQAENVDNPLRCPVKLYEFYLSKCPESIKNRNDVFYLTPERSCVPDSPVWYSTVSLGYDAMARMLNRIRVVKEIQEAHLQMQSHGLLGGFGTE